MNNETKSMNDNDANAIAGSLTVTAMDLLRKADAGALDCVNVMVAFDVNLMANMVTIRDGTTDPTKIAPEIVATLIPMMIHKLSRALDAMEAGEIEGFHVDNDGTPTDGGMPQLNDGAGFTSGRPFIEQRTMSNETKSKKRKPIADTNYSSKMPPGLGMPPGSIQFTPEEIKAVKEREAAQPRLPVPVLFPPRD